MLELRSGKVYVLECSRGLVKVGKAEDPDLRLKLMKKQPNYRGIKLDLVFSTLERPDVSAVEQAAHYILAQHRRAIGSASEWFAVTTEQAINAVNIALERPAPIGKAHSATFPAFRVDEGFFSVLDAVRKRETDVPSRSEMLRRLVRRAYDGNSR